VAVAASFGWGQLVERIGPKRTLLIVLGTWCVGLVIAGSVLSLPTFLLGGAFLGAGLGGVWTSDRVFMLRLSPPDQVGEFFGLYGIAGKFSAVTGPLLYGSIVSTLLNAGWGSAAASPRPIRSSPQGTAARRSNRASTAPDPAPRRGRPGRRPDAGRSWSGSAARRPIPPSPRPPGR